MCATCSIFCFNWRIRTSEKTLPRIKKKSEDEDDAGGDNDGNMEMVMVLV